jgi:hypothetical protein
VLGLLGKEVLLQDLAPVFKLPSRTQQTPTVVPSATKQAGQSQLGPLATLHMRGHHRGFVIPCHDICNNRQSVNCTCADDNIGGSCTTSQRRWIMMTLKAAAEHRHTASLKKHKAVKDQLEELLDIVYMKSGVLPLSLNCVHTDQGVL